MPWPALPQSVVVPSPLFATAGASSSGGTSAPPAEVSPDFTYTGGLLSRVDYASGNYKEFFYVAGKLDRVEYHRIGAPTVVKSFFYTVDGSLDYITQTGV